MGNPVKSVTKSDRFIEIAYIDQVNAPLQMPFDPYFLPIIFRQPSVTIYTGFLRAWESFPDSLNGADNTIAWVPVKEMANESYGKFAKVRCLLPAFSMPAVSPAQ